MKIKHLLFVPLLALSCAGPQATPGSLPGVGNVVIADRLSNQRVNAFAEDADGHIWIGTFRGLNKYSIQDYHQYFCADDTLGLPDNQVTALYSNAAGQLWVGTANGVALRTEEGAFRRICMKGDNRNVSQIVETRDGRMLFNCSGQLFRYDEAADCIVSAILDFGGLTTLVGKDGRIWTASMTELRCFDPSDFSPAGSWPARHPVYHIAMASSGEIWLSGMGELSIFDPRSETWQPLPPAIRREKRLIGGDIDILFVNGTDILLHTIADGMFCYNQTNGRLLHQADPGFP